MLFSDQDQKFFQERNISLEEAQRQWEVLNSGVQPTALDRPCTIGDGIEQLDASVQQSLLEIQQKSVAEGRWTKFVPASGAATRMFALASDGEKQKFCQSLSQFAFYEAVLDWFREQGIDPDELITAERYQELVENLVSDAGLGLGSTPKGLIGFHAYGEETRTAFWEHLCEAVDCLTAEATPMRAHFTVSSDHADKFSEQSEEFTAKQQGAESDISFSVQHPWTDTIARTADGELLRTESGEPVLRPGGHGALLENLHALKADLIFVKNIDNVCHEHAREASVRWIQVLGGYLVRLEEAVHQHLRALKSGENNAVPAAFDFINLTFPQRQVAATEDQDALRAELIDSLSRPLRVCGMVKNEGAAGGGPFWVRKSDGRVTPQIVESVEVDAENADQQKLLKQATHFNPVFMALAVRDENGEPYDLQKFADEGRAILNNKQVQGTKAVVLERPGLWNGGMDDWNSVFIEVPIEVFSPVKTVLDLLKAEHQPQHKEANV